MARHRPSWCRRHSGTRTVSAELSGQTSCSRTTKSRAAWGCVQVATGVRFVSSDELLVEYERTSSSLIRLTGLGCLNRGLSLESLEGIDPLRTFGPADIIAERSPRRAKGNVVSRRLAQRWRTFDNLFLPLAKRAHLRKLLRYEKRVEVLSRRMGLLQLGAGAQLFEIVPGLADTATGGLAAKRSLAAMRQVLESPAYINWASISGAMDAIEIFLKDANLVLDEYDRGRPRKDRFFVSRKQLKGLF